MARAPILTDRAKDVAPEGDVHFSSEIISAGSAFATDQALSFRSLDYITDHSGESHLFEETSSEDSESPMSSSPTGILHANLEVLSRQICLGLGPNPTVVERHQLFCMLASVYHQIITGEGLPPPFWCTLPDLPYGIQNAAAMFQVELEQLAS
jgi:hypothetical protein